MNAPILQHVQQFGAGGRDGKPRWGAMIRSNRFTLGMALILAIVLPEFFHAVVNPGLAGYNRLASIEPSTVISVFALIGAHILLRKVGFLPLIDDKMLILPAFLTSYVTAYGLLAVSFRTFSLYHLVTSLVIGLAWYFFMAVIRARDSSPRLAIVGDLPVDEDFWASRIKWTQLSKPRLPRNVLGIVIDKDMDYSPAWERLFSRAVLRGIPVYELSRLREMVTGRVRLTQHPEEVFGELLPSLPYLRFKRVIDTAIVLPALVIALPLLGLLSILIRLESPGPAIFRQTRIGHQGRRFTCFKLRTMSCGHNGPAFTARADPRITRLGRYLRKWRLDELPQIVNILKGEMSWIGPRPESLSLARDYERAIPYYSYRHAVRPGISGWAAVHQGNVALTDAVSVKLEYDFYYLKNFSIWLDFLIMLMTIRTILTGFGHR